MAINFSTRRIFFSPFVDFHLCCGATIRSFHWYPDCFHILFSPPRQIEMLFLRQPISSFPLYMNVRQRLDIGNRKVVIFPVICLQCTLNVILSQRILVLHHLEILKCNLHILPKLRLRNITFVGVDCHTHQKEIAMSASD